MKAIILLPLFFILTLTGCQTLEKQHAPQEFKIVTVSGGQSRTITDENGEEKTIHISPTKVAEEKAVKLSREGWTLVDFERTPELSNSRRGEGLYSNGTKLTLVFSRPAE